MDRVTDTHVYFWGSPFSNWYDVSFEYKSHKFYNSEQAFMWEKALYFNDHETAKEILSERDPAICKKLGRKVKGFQANAWMNHSYNFMKAINLAKFGQNPELKDLILSTEGAVLVEASPWDKIWGVGLHYNDDAILDEENWTGMNLLGKALMEVRDIL